MCSLRPCRLQDTPCVVCARGVLLPAPCFFYGVQGAGLGLRDTGCGNRSAACPVSGGLTLWPLCVVLGVVADWRGRARCAYLGADAVQVSCVLLERLPCTSGLLSPVRYALTGRCCRFPCPFSLPFRAGAPPAFQSHDWPSGKRFPEQSTHGMGAAAVLKPAGLSKGGSGLWPSRLPRAP